ncbi:flagellar protein FlaG [Herminiimonas sp. CN]|uniref:flagellar protein FlaG n=1 Tax=Herminiimonas sp. CN TaxID=1349818 RepID=UPI0004735E2F|nr:flagellar protein FlaG [Herminiimonas sp. CN]
MSNSIDPIGAGAGVQQLQQSQKIAQPEASGKASGAAFNPRAAGVAGKTSAAPTPPVAKAAVDVKDARDIDTAKLSAAQAEQSLQEINKVLASLSISVQFQIDPGYKDVIVKVVDQDSGKVIRQMPSEDVVRIAKAMDNLKGLLFAQAV